VARVRLDATRTLDKFEQEKTDFFARCRNEYLRLAAEFPQRIVVIDSTQSIEATRAKITQALARLL
jgi:dTMP kinase